MRGFRDSEVLLQVGYDVITAAGWGELIPDIGLSSCLSRDCLLITHRSVSHSMTVFPYSLHFGIFVGQPFRVGLRILGSGVRLFGTNPAYFVESSHKSNTIDILLIVTLFTRTIFTYRSY